VRRCAAEGWPTRHEYTDLRQTFDRNAPKFYSRLHSVQCLCKEGLMNRMFRWLALPVAVVAAGLVFAGTASAAPTVTLDGVRTTLWTDPATTRVLLQHHIAPLPVQGTTVSVRCTPHGKSFGFGFPIPYGRVDVATLA